MICTKPKQMLPKRLYACQSVVFAKFRRNKKELLNKGAALVDSSLKIDGGDECSALHKVAEIELFETKEIIFFFFFVF